ncbi:MAG: PASTA domain-containing protein [Oscillospiraceae bacterium]|nr:PASTA domain-containing protein [Oscillospiraceae bacterium]
MSLAKKIAVMAMTVIFLAICVIIVACNQSEFDINEKLDQAEAYFEMMDYDKTIATYNFIISKDKTCVDAYLGLAAVYSKKGNEKKVFDILEQGLDATNNHTRIAKKIEEMTEEKNSEDEIVVSDITITETEIVTTVPVVETTASETTVTSKIMTEDTSETTETTIATTTATSVSTTNVTTVAAARETTITTTAKPTISVPNFIGISKEEASALAKRKNIKLAFEYENNDAYPNGFIYYQSNREGTLVSSDTKVYAYVCVNDIEYVSEETKALRNLSDALTEIADSNSGRISTDENNNVVTITVNSTKRFVLDETVVKAMRNCGSATLQIVTDDFTMLIPTVSVANVSSLNLSSDYSGNYNRAIFTIGEGAESCDVKVVLTNCTINGSDYKNMKLYTNNKKPSEIELTIDEEPIILVSESGTYTIK